VSDLTDEVSEELRASLVAPAVARHVTRTILHHIIKQVDLLIDAGDTEHPAAWNAAIKQVRTLLVAEMDEAMDPTPPEAAV